MARILFVTGTDTGVGKTVVSAWLAARALKDGTRARYVKPIQTGLAPGDPRSDAGFVARATGVDVLEILRFRAPLAPAVAAELEGQKIDFHEVIEKTRQAAAGVELLIVEGAGGLLVPITREHVIADLAAELPASLVVVARPGLGTLNHTALTVEAASRRGLPIDSLIVSGWPREPDIAATTNRDELAGHGIPTTFLPSFDGLDVESLRPGSFDATS